ncbi:T9SS type A sorting domain-containing protein [Polaribacter sp.]|nr:T9SS type A sorting domain-containing protein [Polaribacter sp.]
MKKITLFIGLLMVSIGFSAQSVIQDFEAAGSLGEPFGGAVSEVVADPEVGGTRGQVAKLTAGGATIWQGANINIASNYFLISDKTITMDVYSETAITFAPKAQGGVSNAPESVSSVDHAGSGWETLTVTFDKTLDGKSVANGEYGQFAIHYFWDTTANGFGTTSARVFYVDNITAITVAPTETCSDGVQNQDETGIDCGGTCNACPEIKLPLDFSSASQLFTFDDAGNGGGSVVMDGGQMRFNGNGHAYDSAYLDLTETFSLFDKDNNTFTVTMNPLLVPDGEERTHLIKATIGATGAAVEITGKSIGSGIQDVTFNFGVMGTENRDRIRIFLDFGQQGTGSDYNGIVTDYLISSITLGADPVVPQVPPTVAAPTAPARNAADVISIYSKTTDAVSVYADIAGVDFPNWGGNSGNVTPEAFENDLALKLPAFTYQGVQFPETDLSSMTMLHLDIWAQAQNVGLDLIPTGGAFKRVNITSSDGEWSSVDIALSDFTDLNLSQIFQMKFYGFDGANADGSLDIYLDNIYFYTGFPLSTDKNNIVNVSLYPNPAKGSLNISAKNTIENATIYNVLGKKIKSFTVNAKTSSLDVSGLSRGIYILKYTANNAVGSMKFVKE